jgi:hypothetical protein
MYYSHDVNFDITATLFRLEKYFLFHKYIDNIPAATDTLQNIMPSALPSALQPAPKPNRENRFSPKQKDSLFWCLYIAKYGFSEYTMIYHNYGVKELEIKKQVVEFIQKNAALMKTHKITKVATQEIMSDLFTVQKETTMQCLISILLFFQINVFMCNDKFMLEFTVDPELPTFLLHKDTHGRYAVVAEPMTEEDMVNLKNEKVLLSNYQKPIRGVSTYKIDELEELVKKIGLYEKEKKYKKADLYDIVIHNMKWL